MVVPPFKHIVYLRQSCLVATSRLMNAGSVLSGVTLGEGRAQGKLGQGGRSRGRY